MLARLLASVFSEEVGEIFDRARLTGILFALAALATLCGLGFLVGAGYVAASREWGSLEAAIYFGAGFLALAIIFVVWQRIAMRLRMRRARRRREGDLRRLASTAAIMILPSLLSRRGAAAGLLVPLLAAVGYAIYRENSGPGDDEPDDEAD